MPLVEFVGHSVQDQDNAAINTSRLINCYRESVIGQGKSQYVIQSVLGQDLLGSVGTATARALGQGDGQNWAIADGDLYSLASTGVPTDTGQNVSDDADTVIAGNYSDVTITAGNNYYVYDGSTVSQPANKTFSSVGSHFYIGGYTVLTEKDGKRFQWSGLADAPTLNALHFASAEKVDDNLVRGFEVQGTAVLFCETSAEMWQITGASGTEVFAFVTSWNRGLKAHNLAVKFDDSLFFVGDDDNVYLGIGPGAVDITTPAINTALEENTATHCYYYEDRGHKFCVLRFSDRPAWVYDVKMREWHERAEGADNSAWRAIASIQGDTWQVGSTAGEIFSLSRTNLDLNAPLRRTMISNPIYLGDKFRVSKMEVNANVGRAMLNQAVDYGLSLGGGFALELGTGFVLEVDSEDGTERAGELSLCVSRDGGETWTDPKVRSLGLSGDYNRRTTWRALGQAQQFSAKLTCSEPADYPINSTAVVEIA